MCGISGIISLGGQLGSHDDELLNRMSKLLTHRGPDHLGYYRSPQVFFANNRLSIIDRDKRSHLPIANQEQTVFLCYNGEVTNYIELINQFNLREKYHFKGTSDSEVVLHLYEELGIDFLDHLSGMFSFCLYDSIKQKVFLVRDPFGITPLFYRLSQDRIFFASEIKALLESCHSEPTLNKQGIYDFLTLAYIPGTQTPYKEITELRNGQMIEFDLKSSSYKQSYYFRAEYKVDQSLTFEHSKTKTYELLLDSVSRSLRSDAVVGTTLSGGIDTSGITCLIRDLGKSQDFHTFSIKMNEKSYDESPYQHIIAKECKTQHHEISVGPEEVIENFYSSIAYLDEPNGDGASVPSYILAKEAKKHVDVLLNGEGGDEVFNAYAIYKAWKMANIYRQKIPQTLQNLAYKVSHLLPTNYEKLSFDFMAKRFTEGALLHPAEAHIYWRHPFNNNDKINIFNDSATMVDSSTRMIALYNEYQHADELNRITMLDLEHFLVDDLLVKNDRMFLAHSIESRFPYLDRILFDFTSTLPVDYKLKGFETRYIQKKALEKTLPRTIYKRPNYGLEMPHSLWFFDSFRPFLKKYINKKTVEKSGLFKWDGIEKMWNDHLGKKRDYGRGLWCILNYLVWHEMFVDKGNYKSYLTQTKS